MRIKTRKENGCIEAKQLKMKDFVQRLHFLFHRVGGTAVKFKGSQLIKTIQTNITLKTAIGYLFVNMGKDIGVSYSKF